MIPGSAVETYFVQYVLHRQKGIKMIMLRSLKSNRCQLLQSNHLDILSSITKLKKALLHILFINLKAALLSATNAVKMHRTSKKTLQNYPHIHKQYFSRQPEKYFFRVLFKFRITSS